MEIGSFKIDLEMNFLFLFLNFLIDRDAELSDSSFHINTKPSRPNIGLRASSNKTTFTKEEKRNKKAQHRIQYIREMINILRNIMAVDRALWAALFVISFVYRNMQSKSLPEPSLMLN